MSFAVRGEIRSKREGVIWPLTLRVGVMNDV
jgi:hypothetical protein